MTSAPIGVLVMAYGTASGPEDVERYYTDIRGGRAPSPELLAELRERFDAIGNRFPLLDTTREQAAGIERELNASEPGSFVSYIGMKHSPPAIAEAIERMRADGLERAVGIVMAPHESRLSTDTYIERVQTVVGDDGPSFSFVRHWHDHPAFVAFLAKRVSDAIAALSQTEVEKTVVVFSAHSLPSRILEWNDPYPAQLQETADLVSAELGLPDVVTAWQSAGRTPEPWLGPPIEETIVDLAAQGYRAIVVCAAGFVADHLETLFDLDIEAQKISANAGVRLVRTEMPNADPEFVRAVASVIRDHLAAATGG